MATVTASQFGDHERAATGIDEQLGVSGLCREQLVAPSKPIDGGSGEGVLAPTAGVVDEDRDQAEAPLGLIKDARWGSRIRQVGLDGKPPLASVSIAATT